MAKNSAKEQCAMSAASVFKAIDNVLKKPGCGCSGSLDYMEQSSWMLFLRYLDAREEERKLEARLDGRVYEPRQYVKRSSIRSMSRSARHGRRCDGLR